MLYHAVKLGRLPQNNQMYHETYPNVTGHLLPLDVNFQFVYATVKNTKEFHNSIQVLCTMASAL
jgi:hypothetical protein